MNIFKHEALLNLHVKSAYENFWQNLLISFMNAGSNLFWDHLVTMIKKKIICIKYVKIVANWVT